MAQWNVYPNPVARARALKAHDAGGLFSRALGRHVASLRAESHRIVDVLDAVVCGV